MNVIAKQAAAGRLRKAMELEKLSTKETAVCLGLNPQYVSMFLNEKLWPKCPAYAFERLIAWCNSGSTLKGWKIPEGASIYKDPEKKQPERPEKVTPVPEFKETSTTVEIPSVMIPENIKHIELKPGDEVEFRRDLKDEHQDRPVKTGEYIDLVEAIKLVAGRMPENVSIVIRINAHA